MTRGKGRRLANLLATAIAMAGPSIVAAQAPPQGEDENSVRNARRFDEIVVTARKREERLLDIPIAVTALSSEQIERAGIENLADVARFTPGFTFSDTAVTGRNDRSFQTGLIIRGMASNSNLSTRQTAQLFLDGAPIPGGGLRATEDIERVEVIKGPQSAYFGRATFAGAVNIITRDPSLNDWGGKLFAEYGRFDSLEIGGALEGPLIPGSVALRVSGQVEERGGSYINAARPSERLGKRRTEAVALTLLARPLDGLDVKAYVSAYRDEDGPPANVLFDSRDFNCDAGAGAGRQNWICGELPQLPRSRIGLNTAVDAQFERQFIANEIGAGAIFDKSFIGEAGLRRKALQSTLRLGYTFGGGMLLQSITGYHRDRRQVIADSDGRDTSNLRNPFFGRVPGVRSFINWLSLVSADDKDFSQELRLTSIQDQRLRWTLGTSYSDHFAVGSFPVDSPFGPLKSLSINERGSETTGIFGALYLDLTDRLTLSAEGRYQWDKIRDRNRASGIVLEDTFRSFAPRLIVDYQLQDDLLLYGSYAVGIRPGAFNGNIAGLPQPVLDQIFQRTGAGLSVEQERLENLEAGLKGRLFDNQLLFTLAAYAGRWSNQHVSTSVSFLDPITGLPRLELVTSAVGKTNIYGVELEATFWPTDRLLLEASLAYNDTSIREYFCAVCLTSITGSADVRGNRIPLSPLTTVTASATYTAPLTRDLEWFARADFFNQGKKYATEANLAHTGSSNVVNARIGIQNDALRLEAFVRNVFDDDTYSSIERSLDLAALTFGNAIAAGLPEQRRWGLRLSYRF